MPQTTTTPMTISYSRFSSPQQAQGDSRRRQADAAQAWCRDHGCTLTETLHDAGLSAYHGVNSTDGHLARFLQMVEAGSIPTGSTLIVESLDRLSRQAVETAVTQFMRIVDAGVRVVTLFDGQTYEKGKMDLGKLMLSILAMHVAFEESEKKSIRSRAANAAKRKSGAILNGTVPAWCHIVDGKIVLDEAKASVVREMASMSIAGHGNTAIAKMVNAKYPDFCAKGFINPSRVHFILRNPALTGRHQPMTLSRQGAKRVRTAVGPLIEGYYPRILSDDEFFAVQHARAGRRRSGGPSTQWTNLFSGLLRDADGSSLTVIRSGVQNKHRSFVSSAAARGSIGASAYVAYPIVPFESAILVQLSDVILPAMATTSNNDGAVKVASLTSQIGQLDNKIADIQSMVMSTSSPSIVAMLLQMDAKRVGLVAELDSAKGEQAAQALVPINAAREQLAVLVNYCRHGTSDLTEDQRVQAKAALARVVKSITSKFSMIVGGRQADVTVELVDGRRFELVIAAIKGLREPIVRGQRFVACGSVVMPTEMARAISQQYSDELAVAVAA